MSNIAVKNNILALSKSLIEDDLEFAEVKLRIDEIGKIFADITGISVSDGISNDPVTWLDSGLAISPIMAARCLNETLRTQRFLFGSWQAIQDVLAAQSTVNVLYAGSGPYGTILLPLLPLLDSRQIQVTIIDIHDENINAINKLIDECELSDYVSTVYHGDATKWQPDSKEKFDILISETMNTFLKKEPQVSIFAHLQQFLMPKGVLIPQEVRTSIGLKYRVPGEKAGWHEKKQALFALNRQSAEQIRVSASEKLSFTFETPETDSPINGLALYTGITVYKNIELGDFECSLTLPQTINNQALAGGAKFQVEYEVFPKPDWHFHLQNLFDDLPLPQLTDRSGGELPYVARFWDKYRRLFSNALDPEILSAEWQYSQAFTDLVGKDLTAIATYLQTEIPSLEEFVDWCQLDEIAQEKIEKYSQEIITFGE